MQAPLADGLVLAFPGDWRLWVLNAEAAIIWELNGAGLSPADMTVRLADFTGIDPAVLKVQIDQLLTDWQRTGLLQAVRQSYDSPPGSPDAGSPSRSPPRPVQPPGAAFQYVLADTRLAISVSDASITAILRPLLAGLQAEPQEGPPAALLQLSGTMDNWQLRVDGVLCAYGTTLDSAVVALLGETIERACRTPERLLVVHGSGLVMQDGQGILLIAPGGSGKTTLATALNAAGWPLLSDDVVPVNLDGTLAGLGMPICVKAGSWPVLATLRPELYDQPIIQRYQQSIRYLPPRGSSQFNPVPLGLMLFPRYDAASSPRIERLTPITALQGLIEAEAVVRHLTQDRLDRLAQWISAAPAYAITYPDLESALNLVQRLLADGPPDATDR